DEKRGPRPVDDPREHVPPERIRPEEMLERRPLEKVTEVERGRVVRSDSVGESCREEHDDDEDGTRRPERTSADEFAPEPREPARSGRLEIAAPGDVVGLAHGRGSQLRHEYRIRGSRTT